MSKSKAQLAREETEKQEAIAHLRRVAPPGSKIYGVVKHVSRSGMMRHIDFYVPVADENGKTHMQYLTGWFESVLRWGRADNGLKVGGCGMDMIFHTVYCVSSAVWTGTDEAEEYRKAHETKWSSAGPGYVWSHDYL